MDPHLEPQAPILWDLSQAHLCTSMFCLQVQKDRNKLFYVRLYHLLSTRLIEVTSKQLGACTAFHDPN